ncbi:MAG: hypothetical protein D6798_04665, partial [Deltaproteobacteria bacterium]
MRAEILILALAGTACLPGGDTLARLQAAYGADTAARLEDPLTATVLAGALGADLCVTSGTGAWSAVRAGDAPPLSYELADALGAPVVGEVSEASALEIRLDEVAIMGGTDRIVRLTAVDGSPFTVTGTVADPDGGQVGRFDLSVVDGCSSQWARASGSATWTDAAGVEHSLDFPPESVGEGGLDWPGEAGWLPATGTVAWTARIDSEPRSFTSADASGI